MPIEVEVPDLGTVEFPEGTSQEAILSSIQGHRSPRQPSSNAVMDAIRRVPEGASVGVGQSLQGAARAGDVYQRNVPAGLRSILEAAAPGFRMLSGAAPINPGNLSTSPLAVYGSEYVEQPAQQAYGVDRLRDQTLLGQVGSSAGQMLPTIATGILAGPVAIPAAMAQYGLASGEQSAKEAEQMMPGNQGVTDRAFLGGAASGAITEGALGVAGRLGRIALGGTRVPAALASVAARSPTLARGIEGAAREGSQEALEQLAQNYVASDVAGYDPNRPVTQGVGQAALLGSLVGGPASAAAQAVSRAGAGQNVARVLASEIENAPLGRAEDLPFNQQVQLNRPAMVAEDFQRPAPPENAVTAKPSSATALPELVSPAVRIGDRTFTANSHPDALGEATKASLDDTALGDALTDFVIDPKPENQGFMVKDASGKERFASRAEAADIFEKATGKKPAKEGMLTSEDMRDAGLLEKPKADDAKREALNEWLKPKADEMRGQAILQMLDDEGKSPRKVANEFWDKTYPLLPEVVKQRFHDNIRDVVGGGPEAPGDTWRSIWQGPRTVYDLEGTERGLVALMETANRNRPEAPKAIAAQAGPDYVAEVRGAAQTPDAVRARYPETFDVPTYGQLPVEILRPDGSTYGGVFNGWMETIKPGTSKEDYLAGKGTVQVPSIGTRQEGSWSHGSLKAGEKLLSEVPTPEEFKAARAKTQFPDFEAMAKERASTKAQAEVAPILDRLETVEQAGMISDAQQVQLNGLRESLKGGWEAAKKWADNRLKEQQSRFSSNPFADPTYIIALGIRGAELIAGGVKKFGEWSAKMVGQFGEGIRPHLEDIYRESLINEGAIKKYPVETDEMKTRKSVESAIESEAIPDEVKGMLANDPASQYAVQRVSSKPGVNSVEDLVAGMTEGELAAVPIRSNIYVWAKAELAIRLMDQGRTGEGYSMLQDVMAEGTNFGQLVNQFKYLNKVDPTYVPRLLNQQLIRNGYDPLTEAQAKILADKSKADIDAGRKATAAKQKWLKDPTDANAEAVDAATAAAKEPALELQREMLKRQPKSLPQVLKAVVQGNLLTPISEVSNIAGNINFMPFRAAAEGGAAALDALDSFIRKRPREILFTPGDTTAAGLRGAVQGAKEIPGILKRGQSDVMTGERFRGLQPMKAWKNLLTKAPDVPTIGGKVPLQDRLAMAVEGTFGMPAEVMLRGLAAGDAPFKAKAHAQAVDRQLNLAKVKAEDMAMARKYPELFMDEKGMQAIHEETLRAVFQQPSETITSLNRWIRNKGGDWGDFAATLIAPYRQTPWNLIGEIFSYNPLIGALKAAVEAKKGNVAGAERAAAKAAVGGVLTYAGWWLYKSGLLAPSLDDEDEQQKSRLLSAQVLPPNHINLSGLERKMTGGSAAFRPGDTTVDTSKLGLAGAHFYTTANLGRDFEKKPRGATENAAAWLQNSIMEEARYGLNQSFLKGTSTALDAIRTGRTDEFIRGLENTLLSIPVPNTVSAVSRATSPNKVVVKDDSKLKEFDNILQQRLRVFGLGKDLPVSRGLWGEPLPETPEGSNPFAYHFLDITKNQQVTSDPAANEIYRLWRKTANTSVIPTPPNASLEFKRQNYVLTPEQQSQLQAAVGPVRKRITDDLVNNPNFQKLEDDSKIRILSRAYAAGLRVGKAQFLSEHGQELEARGKKAGFTPE